MVIKAHLHYTLDELEGATAHLEIDMLPEEMRRTIIDKRDRYEQAVRALIVKGVTRGEFAPLRRRAGHARHARRAQLDLALVPARRRAERRRDRRRARRLPGARDRRRTRCNENRAREGRIRRQKDEHRAEEESINATRTSRCASTARNSRSRSRPTRRCSRCCARTSTSPAPSTAASWASAAPARCWSTASRCCPAWCSRSSAKARRIETIEGLAAGAELHPLQAAFADLGGSQCGYCTPGHDDDGEGPARQGSECRAASGSRRRLSGNLCRCTGYQQIVESVEDAARVHARGAA